MFKTLIVTCILMASCLAFGFTFSKSCNPDARQLVLSDLTYLNEIQKSHASRLHESIFGKATYIKYFMSRVSEIDCVNMTLPVAYVDTNKDPRLVQIGTFYKEYPQPVRASILLHEAKHSEAEHNYWKHEVRSGIPGDLQPDGAYGSDIVFLENLAQYCTNCSQNDKKDASYYAKSTLLYRIFSREAFDILNADIFSNQISVQETLLFHAPNLVGE